MKAKVTIVKARKDLGEEQDTRFDSINITLGKNGITTIEFYNGAVVVQKMSTASIRPGDTLCIHDFIGVSTRKE